MNPFFIFFAPFSFFQSPARFCSTRFFVCLFFFVQNKLRCDSYVGKCLLGTSCISDSTFPTIAQAPCSHAVTVAFFYQFIVPKTDSTWQCPDVLILQFYFLFFFFWHNKPAGPVSGIKFVTFLILYAREVVVYLLTLRAWLS